MQIISKKEAMIKLAEYAEDLLEALYVADMNSVIGRKGIVTMDRRFVAMHKVVDCRIQDLMEDSDKKRLIFFWDSELADDIMTNRLIEKD